MFFGNKCLGDIWENSFLKFELMERLFLTLGQSDGQQKDAQGYKDNFMSCKVFREIKSFGDILEVLFPKVVLAILVIFSPPKGRFFFTLGQSVKVQKDAQEYKDKIMCNKLIFRIKGKGDI